MEMATLPILTAFHLRSLPNKAFKAFLHLLQRHPEFGNVTSGFFNALFTDVPRE
jgi:hypothetical protein